MHPELFHFQLPDFLSNLFNVKQITVYTYAFCITLGCLITGIYTKQAAKKDLGIQNLSNNFFYLIFISGFVGGKLFYYLENPSYYWHNPSLLLDNFSGGFVFYGSFVTIIPVIVWYLKKQSILVLPMLDILAITTLIVHALGRFGCFNAGCCYGLPTNSIIGMTFPATNHIAVHPTQLYEVFILLGLLTMLYIIKKKKKFHGQIFLLYISLYGISRAILEIFRGDSRGFIIKDIVSHSQFIGFLLLVTSIIFYTKLKKQNITNLNN
ncbi:prolipoprotein diacylglyceryl transferase [Flavobacterium sp. XS2P14]|uniref:prolipoprotein diacylglyceryl transferase n=1 Tax=Flavobacterium sp. XS2P14 TaxID=3401735 RepID=UPI003AABE6F9